MKFHTLFKFNQVPVRANLGFFFAWGALWGLLTWLAGKRKPERSIFKRLGIGLLLTSIPMSADVGHAMAHSVSARAANAPMDEIRLGMDMPRTIYLDEQVTPTQHIQRSLGGPLYNIAGFGLSYLWRRTTVPGSFSREMADLAGLSHGALALGSLAPLPIIDGGTILKWWWIKQGMDTDEAEKRLRRISINLGAGLFAGGFALLVIGRRLWGMLLAALGGVCAATGVGLIR